MTDPQDKKPMENEQCVAARDTTFDNIIPEKIWASVRTTPDRKYIRFIIEINGIEKVIDQAYVGSYDGIISSSTQLTWILLKQKEAYESMRQRAERAESRLANTKTIYCELCEANGKENAALKARVEKLRVALTKLGETLNNHRLVENVLTADDALAKGEK